MRILGHLTLIVQSTHLLAKIHGQVKRNSAGVRSNLKMFLINVLTTEANANAKVMFSTWQNLLLAIRHLITLTLTKPSGPSTQ
jgi:hypothetical protein